MESLDLFAEAKAAAERPRAGTKAKAGDTSASSGILERLNDEQLAAVTHGHGPLLIVAGAGTGKTEAVTKRIAWLISEKRARPEEILALTFTEKAAAEMEARVDVLVPYGFTGTWISTFHAFGDGLVREYGIELGLTRDLRVCSRAEVLVFLREHLFDLGLERYLPLGNPDRHLDELLSLFDRARDEDVTPETYHAFAAQLEAEADDPDAHDRAQAEIEKARAYARYTELMQRSGRVDFADQLAIALRLLRERPRVLRELRDRIRWILVDEFQDTNHVQFEMVKLLAGEQANLTVVGDDDQSIYRFRGAKWANLVAFLETYPQAHTVLLKKNYRTRQNILDAAHRMIRNNDPDRLEAQKGYDKRLVAVNGAPGALDWKEFTTMSDEADFVASSIAAQIEAGRQPGEFAILTRTHNQLTPFLQALAARGVPFQMSQNKGLYRREEVRLCLSMLRTIADPDDSRSVYHLLGSFLFEADPTDLARLSAHAHRHNVSLRRVAESLAHDQLGFPLLDATLEAAARFSALARELNGLATRRPTSEVLYSFVKESGMLSRLTSLETIEAEEQIRNISKLFTITQRIGEMLEHDRVESFIRHLDLLIEAGDDPAAAEVDLDANAVHALTAHNAKGLEFNAVFLCSLVEGRFPARDRPDALPLPGELTRASPTRGDADLQEERRLFYVGMTRARETLHLSYAIDYGGKQRWKMSRFIAEALSLGPKAASTQKLDPRQVIERFSPAATPPTAVRGPMADDDILRLSHRRIEDYLTCPLKYRFAHEIQVPIEANPVLMYGNAMHHAIRIFYQHRLRGHPIEVEDVVQAFEEAWSSQGFISREHEERRLEQGREGLRRFVERETGAKTQPLQVEQQFRFLRGANSIEGRWDRIDERDGGIVIVDFKTTEIDESEDADQLASNSLRGGQLGLYALAYRETREVTPQRVELRFVDSGATGSAAVAATHLNEALRRIDDAARGIRAADFTPRPKFRACSQCPYDNFCPHTATKRTL